MSFAAVPMVPVNGVSVVMTNVGEVGWLIVGAAAFGVGLLLSANYRTCNLLREEERGAQRQLSAFAEIEHSPTDLEQALKTAGAALDAQYDAALGGGPEGAIPFIRPSRRFFNTPQTDDPLDKATLEDYSAADLPLRATVADRVVPGQFGAGTTSHRTRVPARATEAPGLGTG